VQIETIEDEITSEKLHFRMKTLEFYRSFLYFLQGKGNTRLVAWISFDANGKTGRQHVISSGQKGTGKATNFPDQNEIP